MSHYILQFLALLSLLSFTRGSLYSSSWVQLQQMKLRVNTIHEALLTEQCPGLPHKLIERSLTSPSSNAILLELETKLYSHLFDLLVSCRKSKTSTTNSGKTTAVAMETTILKKTTAPMTGSTTQPTTQTTTAPTPPTTTPDVTTTTATSAPVECLNAINLTESWRLDHSGSRIRPNNGDHNCDTKDMINAGRPWFKFTGNAGDKLLDHCVPIWSCGTGATMWSNSTMPDKVGVVTPITVYGHASGRCTYFTLKSSVMRCSSRANDYVYRYDDLDRCWMGFCGMRA